MEEFVIDVLSDAVIDTLKLIPFLFVTYLAMEALEHKAGERAENAVRKAGVAGPLVGSLLGVVPQCGFSAMASTFYAGRVITLGTLIAVFLATSDEMLPIAIAQQADPAIIGKILLAKVLIGIVMGFIIDVVLRARHSKAATPDPHVEDLCTKDDCNCEDGILKSAIKHTLEVTFFIFLVTLVLTGVMDSVGEEAFGAFISSSLILSIVASALVGLIPNCAASVVITELYLEGVLGVPAMMSGLLVSAGVGLLVLLRTNRPASSNAKIIALLFVIGVAWGFVFQLAGITF